MSSQDPRAAAPQSVGRVLAILEALCESAAPRSLAELSRVLALPKSSLAALLRGLASAGYVEAVEGSSYRLGPQAFGLGSALVEARRRAASPDLIHAGLQRVAQLSGETALLAIRDADGLSLSYVDVIQSRNAVRFAVAVGDRRPLYATAGGRVLLAAEPVEAVERYFAGLIPQRLTERTETDHATLREAVTQARETGLAQTLDQAGDGVAGTAAPLRDAGGAVIGALVVAAPTARLHDRSAELAALVCEEAAAISRSLGYRQPAP